MKVIVKKTVKLELKELSTASVAATMEIPKLKNKKEEYLIENI